MALQSLHGLGPDVRGLVLFCTDCKKRRAHYQAPSGAAICGSCGAAKHKCAGGCGRYCSADVAFCSEACEAAVRR